MPVHRLEMGAYGINEKLGCGRYFTTTHIIFDGCNHCSKVGAPSHYCTLFIYPSYPYRYLCHFITFAPSMFFYKYLFRIRLLQGLKRMTKTSELECVKRDGKKGGGRVDI